MTNLRLEFVYPWLLLLLIPAAVLTFLPYFRLAKRYRRTRNRVVSIVLHSIVMTLAILMLAGFTIRYELPNKDNQLLLVVDSSYSNQEEKDNKEDFVEQVLRKCGEDYNVGVIKFGYDQVYAAEMSTDSTEVYKQFLQSEDPDDSATDVESALNYAFSLLQEKPKTSKIVLITDGEETDGDAFEVISKIAAKGVKVDTVHFPNERKVDAQIVDVVLPEGAEVGKEFNMTITLEGSVTGAEQYIELVLIDNGTEAGSVVFELTEQTITKTVKYTLDTPGLHQLRFDLTYSGDTIAENNSYYTYMYLHVFEDILLIEKDEGEGEELRKILTDKDYIVTSYSIEEDVEELPTTVTELCDYEQVVLVNIANSDMPEGFVEILNDYVHNYGGGMFTVGGNNDTAGGEIVPHAYNRDDMYKTLYQEMLPVQVVNYTLPVAVMLLIDSSGSMGMGVNSNLDLALKGASACLEGLNSRDYLGVATFQDKYDEGLKVTPVSKRSEIEQIIHDLSNEGNGGTIFQAAIEGAGTALSAVDVEKRHIILVTDGMPSDTGKYEEYIDENLARGITMSIVCVGSTNDYVAKMQQDAKRGGGVCVAVYNSNEIASTMYNIMVDEVIEGINYGEEFKPTIGDYNSAVAGITPADIPVLTGYYGTKLKTGAIAPLKGKYVPIYATWGYGNGTVGSFMCDLNGTWSEKFIADAVGQQLIGQIVNSIFPLKQIESNEIFVKRVDDNYTTKLFVDAHTTENDTVEVKVTPVSSEAVTYYQDKVIEVKSYNANSSFEFDVTCPGIYQVTLTKKTLNENGEWEIVTEKSFYKNFAYSAEYDIFPEDEGELTSLEYLQELAEDGRGIVAEDPYEVFLSFSKTIVKVYDPRWLFASIAITLFLLDIAVRKFKWKWIHEIIRERRANQGFKK